MINGLMSHYTMNNNYVCSKISTIFHPKKERSKEYTHQENTENWINHLAGLDSKFLEFFLSSYFLFIENDINLFRI